MRSIYAAWERGGYGSAEWADPEIECGRGKTSGLDLAQLRSNGAVLCEVRGDKVTRIVSHVDRERALADLGLASEGGPTMAAHV